MKWFLLVIVFLPSVAFGQAQVTRLPEDLAQKTISLNPEFLVFGKAQVKNDEKLPLLIYLHGSGGTGDQIRRIERQPHRLLETIKKAGLRCLCVAPQAMKSPRNQGKKGGWVPADLDILLQHLATILPLDDKKIYLTGNSMGGYGTYAWAGKSPHHFAAIAPMVGGLGPGGPKDVTPDLEAWGRNLAKIPMKAYYGGQDRVVPADRGSMILEAIKKAGGEKAQLIILPEESHGAGKVPYGDIEFVKWMFSQKRD